MNITSIGCSLVHGWMKGTARAIYAILHCGQLGNIYVIVIAWEGVLYAEYSTRGWVERTIQDEAKPIAVLFSRPCPEYYILRTALPPMP